MTETERLFYDAGVVREAGNFSRTTWMKSLVNLIEHLEAEGETDLARLARRMTKVETPGGDFWYAEASRFVRHFMLRQWAEEHAVMCAAA